MRNDELFSKGESVECMQSNLQRGEPGIMASYALIGAVLGFGGAGFAADRYFGTTPWCLLGGLLAGIGIGFFEVIRATSQPH